MRALLLAVLASGCTGGFGPSTAATRPVFGNVSSDGGLDGWSWQPTGDQRGVPKGYQRVELVHNDVVDSLGTVLSFFSVTSGVRKGSVTPTLAGVEQGDRQTIDMELSLLFHAPTPIAVAVGPMIGWALESQGDEPGSMRGYGIKASVAPIGQLSVDFTRIWGSSDAGDSASNMSLGGTLLLFGYKVTRFGVSVARTWTSTLDYTSKGYSYSLVITLF